LRNPEKLLRLIARESLAGKDIPIEGASIILMFFLRSAPLGSALMPMSVAARKPLAIRVAFVSDWD
jgi:hypothetical protein